MGESGEEIKLDMQIDIDAYRREQSATVQEGTGEAETS